MPPAAFGLTAYEAAIAATALAGTVTVYMAFATFYDRPKRRRDRDEQIETVERSAARVEIDSLGVVLAASRFEAAVLRELIAETRPGRVFERLLARIVPDATRAAAEIFSADDAGEIVLASRGDRRRHAPESRAGRRPATPDWSFESTTASSRTFRLETTTLGPVVADETGEAVVRRLFEAAVKVHDQRRAAETAAEDLWFAHERLALRQVSDGHPDKPAEMLGAFVDDLARRIGADRAALFLSPVAGEGDFKLLARRGAAASPGIDRTAKANDLALARATQYGSDLLSLSGQRLRNTGVVSLDGAALALALHRGGRPLGAVVLTRVRPDEFDGRARRLAEWSAAHLGESISRVANRAAMVRMARRDGLTDLANRREFDERLAAVLAAGGPVVLLMCDVDKFKRVNDTYGHLAGDEVIRAVAGVVRDEMLRTRATDEAMAARYGGEEIALLLPGFGLAGGERVAESVRAAVERAEIVAEGRSIRVTTSVGVAAATGVDVTPEMIIGAADAALYEAKQTGRNRVCVGDPSDAAKPQARPAATKVTA